MEMSSIIGFSDLLILVFLVLYSVGIAPHAPWWVWVLIVLSVIGDGLSVGKNRQWGEHLLSAIKGIKP